VHNRAALRTILLATVLVLVVPACYRPSLGDCQVRCSAAAPGCPEGLSCDMAEGFCQGDQAFDCSSLPVPDGGPNPDGSIPPGTESYSALSVGNAHACAIRADDGSMWCWGYGPDGALGDGLSETNPLPVHVGNLDGWFAVSAGYDFTCGLRDGDAATGGSLYCWGLNNVGQIDLGTQGTNVSAPLDIGQGKKWKSVSAGRGGTLCAIDVADHLYCGGDNENGQVGTGASGQFLPLAMVGSATWRMVAAGYYHVCGIQTSGELYCWGGNNDSRPSVGEDGVLGTGDNLEHATPTKVGSASDWVTVSPSGAFTCGIRGAASGGNLYCWGRDSGNLGTVGGGGASVTTPRLVGNATSDKNWKSIASDGRHSCGIRDVEGADRLFCFGLGEDGSLGFGARKDITSPTILEAASTWLSTGVGAASSCALRDDGAVLCWGLDDDGQLGDGHRSLETLPVRVGQDSDWSSVALGEFHSCGLRGSALSCWGMNAYGQLGLGAGETTEHPTPQAVAGSWKSVAAGNFHTCAIDGTSSLLCWGSNYDGALGTGDADGNVAPHSVPKKVNGSGVPPDWSSVDAGLTHTCAIAGATSLWCWGSNYAGQVGRDPMLGGGNRPVRVGTDTDWLGVACGTDFTCATHEAAIGGPTIFCFGNNDHGQAGAETTPGVPTMLDQGAALYGDLVATGDHTCGIVEPNDELRCWGVGGTGQLGQGGDELGDSATPVTPITAGPWLAVGVGHAHTCAIAKGDGTLWCWGSKRFGQLGDQQSGEDFENEPHQVGSDTDWKLVYGGWEHTCAIKTDGSLWCWGHNDRGQLGTGEDSTLSPARIADPHHP
jgi:alpha-tubulin suppressor-like RCC1 family protein